MKYKYEDINELTIKIEAYFKIQEANKEPFCFTGICNYLNLAKQTFIRYQKEHPNTEIRDVLSAAKQRCEEYAEKQLFGRYPTGPIFALKNYGWKDKVEIEGEGAFLIKIVDFTKKNNEEAPSLIDEKEEKADE